jgi:hypothetical protein
MGGPARARMRQSWRGETVYAVKRPLQPSLRREPHPGWCSPAVPAKVHRKSNALEAEGNTVGMAPGATQGSMWRSQRQGRSVHLCCPPSRALLKDFKRSPEATQALRVVLGVIA